MLFRKHRFTLSTLVRVCVIAVVFTLFVVPYLIHEPPRNTDTWGTWFFARMIWESFEFPVAGRSPVYALFISIFFPAGYPEGPALARIFDALFIFSGLLVLFRKYMNFGLAVFAAVIWIPSLVEIEGIVKSHAVAALCWAVALRHNIPSRRYRSFSYAFLLLASMFRPNYTLVLLCFIIIDLYRVIRNDGISKLYSNVRPTLCDLPIALLLSIVVLTTTFQSQHRWNNAQYTDIEWLGSTQHSLDTAALVGSFAQWIINNKYDGNFDDHDIYFIARDDLPELRSPVDVLKYPDVLFGTIYTNKQLISVIARITDLGDLMFKTASKLGSHILMYPIFYSIIGFGFVQFHRIRVVPEYRQRIYELGASVIILTVPLVVAWPASEYFYHFVPLFVFAAIGLGDRMARGFDSTARSSGYLKTAIIILLIVTFSNVTSRTVSVFRDATEAESWRRPNLVKEVFDGKFNEIEHLTSNCRGVLLSLDYSFMAAFSKKPLNTFYSIFEIPPFDEYGNSPYDGLRPDRIDCIVVNKDEVKRNNKTFTTKWSRYENYIVPYLDILQKRGAKTYEFGAVGNIELTVLHPPEEAL